MAVQNLDMRFGGLEALRDINLSLAPGERRAIIGPNGAGKTTLFNVISGALRPSRGRIYFSGVDVTRLAPDRRARLGLSRTFQMTNLFRTLSVRENVFLALAALTPRKFSMLRPLSSHGDIARAAEALLSDWGMLGLADRPVKSLSYGDQRQVELILALAGRPKLLLMDEPTAGLSPAETRRVVDTLHGLDKSITVLLIEHDLEVAFAIAERVTVLHLGSVVIEGTPAEIRRDSRVQEIYLGGPEA
ncbi:MAG TPA: ABC transporter ATP-binding protein [Candidatus Acidoferrales bacterium]|nr:ABC transporter ATP-binding protein [Candidatus Acidoferrales bacterium]